MSKTTVYINRRFEAFLRPEKEQGRGLSARFSETVDRYYYLIETERKRMKREFTGGEWETMTEVTKGHLWRPAETVRGGVYTVLRDYIAETSKLDGTWITKDQLRKGLKGEEPITCGGKDITHLQWKLLSLSPLQEFALIEMLEEAHHKRRMERSQYRGTL